MVDKLSYFCRKQITLFLPAQKCNISWFYNLSNRLLIHLSTNTIQPRGQGHPNIAKTIDERQARIFLTKYVE